MMIKTYIAQREHLQLSLRGRCRLHLGEVVGRAAESQSQQMVNGYDGVGDEIAKYTLRCLKPLRHRSKRARLAVAAAFVVAEVKDACGPEVSTRSPSSQWLSRCRRYLLECLRYSCAPPLRGVEGRMPPFDEAAKPPSRRSLRRRRRCEGSRETQH